MNPPTGSLIPMDRLKLLKRCDEVLAWVDQMRKEAQEAYLEEMLKKLNSKHAWVYDIFSLFRKRTVYTREGVLEFLKMEVDYSQWDTPPAIYQRKGTVCSSIVNTVKRLKRAMLNSNEDTVYISAQDYEDGAF